MTQGLSDNLEPTEFDALIEDYAARSEPDTLSFEAFDQATHQLVQEAVAETIELPDPGHWLEHPAREVRALSHIEILAEVIGR